MVEVMIVVGVIALLAAIGIPGVLRAKANSNQSIAQAAVKSIANACEMFASANQGNYPADEDTLRAANPPYQNRPYCGQTVNGYTFSCSFDSTGYTIDATPSTCGSTGAMNYNASTGVVMTSSPCS